MQSINKINSTSIQVKSRSGKRQEFYLHVTEIKKTGGCVQDCQRQHIASF